MVFIENDKINDKLNDKINGLDRAILSQIKQNKFITIPELANNTEKSEPTIYRHLVKMMGEGTLRRMGSRKAGYWEVVD